MLIQTVVVTGFYLLALASFIIGIVRYKSPNMNWCALGLAFWAVGGIIRLVWL